MIWLLVSGVFELLDQGTCPPPAIHTIFRVAYTPVDRRTIVIVAVVAAVSIVLLCTALWNCRNHGNFRLYLDFTKQACTVEPDPVMFRGTCLLPVKERQCISRCCYEKQQQD